MALVWSCAPLLALALTVGARRGSPSDDRSSDAAGSVQPVEGSAVEASRVEASSATVTTIVRLGDEPREIARASLALARRAGPVQVATRQDVTHDELGLEPGTVHRDDDPATALRRAAAAATTDAVIIVSARAVPEMEACRSAAARLDEHTGWVVGDSVPFNRDRYASDRREVMGAALRRRARRRGLVLWENDATLVRTDLVVETPLRDGQPWGAWLRDRSDAGIGGACVDAALSVRAAPVAAGSYWPDAMARQRAAAADLADAARRGTWRSRLTALALLARELYATPLLVWLLAPVLLGDGTAFTVDPWLALAALGLTAVLRWWSLRAVTGVEPLPRADLVAALYHAPGSLGSWSSALRRRIRPVRVGSHARPLVWAALALTVVVAVGLLQRDPGRASSRVAVALSLVLLAALWALTVRSLVERNWSRSAFRVRLSLPATIDGVDARTLDGSPGGVALLGRFPTDRVGVGAEVDVDIELDDGTTITSPGVVAARRRRRGADLLGVELHPPADALEGWSAQLLRSSRRSPTTTPQRPVSVAHHRTRGRAGVLVDRVVMTLVVLVSVAVLGALTLVLLGYQPFVVRSGSMVPTYHVGDVVLVEQVRADELRPGEVASLRYYPEYGESLTHRIRSVRDVDGGVQVETRGDANDSSEVWTVAPDEMVGRVVASVPAIGAPATLVRTAVVPLVIAVVVLAALVAAVLGGHRLRRRHRGSPLDGGPGDVDDDGAGEDADALPVEQDRDPTTVPPQPD